MDAGIRAVAEFVRDPCVCRVRYGTSVRGSVLLRDRSGRGSVVCWVRYGSVACCGCDNRYGDPYCFGGICRIRYGNRCVCGFRYGTVWLLAAAATVDAEMLRYWSVCGLASSVPSWSSNTTSKSRSLYYYFRFGFLPPLFIVIDCYHETNTRDHPTRWFCRIYPSFYRVVLDLFLSLYVSFLFLFVFFFFLL